MWRLPLVAQTITDEMLSHINALVGLAEQANHLLDDARRGENNFHCAFLDQYHVLEVMPAFNAAQGYYISKSLQETLQSRRQAKWDSETLESLVVMINDSGLTKALERAKGGLNKVARSVNRQNDEAIRYVNEGPRRSEAAD